MVLAAEPMACPVSLRRSQPHSMGFLTWCCTAMVVSFRCWKVAAQVWRPVVAYISPSRRPPRAAIRHRGSLRRLAAEVRSHPHVLPRFGGGHRREAGYQTVCSLVSDHDLLRGE